MHVGGVDDVPVRNRTHSRDDVARFDKGEDRRMLNAWKAIDPGAFVVS